MRHLHEVVEEIHLSISNDLRQRLAAAPADKRSELIQEATCQNVQRVLELVREQSPILKRLDDAGSIAIVGGLYDVSTGGIDIFPNRLQPQ